MRADEINVPIVRGSVEITRSGTVLGSIPFALAAEVTVSKEERAAGTYVSWVVKGAVEIWIEKLEGFNAVASGIFLDPE